MRCLAAVLGLVIILALLPSDAAAGKVLIVETDSFDSQEASGTATIYLDKKRLRIDSTEGGGDISVIYNMQDAEAPFYWVLDRKSKTYMEFTKAEIDQMKTQIEKTRKEMVTHMESMTPEQRTYTQRILDEQFGGQDGSGAKTEYKRVSEGVKVNKWKCDHYEGSRDGSKHEEVWATDWKELGLVPADVSVMGKMASLFAELGQKMPAFFHFSIEQPGSEAPKGFPVLVISYKDGARSEKSQVKEVRSEKFAADLFELPEGFTKKPLGAAR
jgi:hypothetical protein